MKSIFISSSENKNSQFKYIFPEICYMTNSKIQILENQNIENIKDMLIYKLESTLCQINSKEYKYIIIEDTIIANDNLTFGRYIGETIKKFGFSYVLKELSKFEKITFESHICYYKENQFYFSSSLLDGRFQFFLYNYYKNQYLEKFFLPDYSQKVIDIDNYPRVKNFKQVRNIIEKDMENTK